MMKMWFRGEGESKVKKSISRKGTLSDELSKASRIGRQLRYDEDKLGQGNQQRQQSAEVKEEVQPLSDNNLPTPWHRQTLKPDHIIKYASKDTVEVTRTIIGNETTYEEAVGESYEAVYEETYEKQYGVPYEKKQEEPRLVLKKSKVGLKANITIAFELEDIELLNNSVASVMALLNSSGVQFDFKITHDGKGGQNLNIIAPTSTIGQILALFE